MSENAHDLTVKGFNRNEFAERLRVAIPKGETLKEVAKNVGVSLSGLRKWLSADADPSVSSMIEFSLVYNVSLLWLLTGDGNMRSDMSARNTVMHSSGVLSLEAIESIKKSVQYAERIIDAHDLTLDADDRSRLVMIIFEMLVGKTDEEMEKEKDRVENVVKLFG